MTRPSSTTIGAFAAKTRLSELLERVRHGERFLITHRGAPIAKLEPVEEPGVQRDPEALLSAFKEFQEAHPLPDITTRDLIYEDRR